MDAGLDTGLYSFVLDIPPGFQRDLLAGRRPALQLNVDATQMRQSFIGAGQVQAMLLQEIQEFVAGERASSEAPVELAVRMRFNPSSDSARFTAVMELINMVTMLSIILAGAALIREREQGTLEHLLTLPLRPVEIATDDSAALPLAPGSIDLAMSLLALQFVNDLPGVLAVVVLASFAVAFLGLVSDIIYAYLDPRVRYR